MDIHTSCVSTTRRCLILWSIVYAMSTPHNKHIALPWPFLARRHAPRLGVAPAPTCAETQSPPANRDQSSDCATRVTPPPRSSPSHSTPASAANPAAQCPSAGLAGLLVVARCSRSASRSPKTCLFSFGADRITLSPPTMSQESPTREPSHHPQQCSPSPSALVSKQTLSPWVSPTSRRRPCADGTLVPPDPASSSVIRAEDRRPPDPRRQYRERARFCAPLSVACTCGTCPGFSGSATATPR